jgi:hypothetical protein
MTDAPDIQQQDPTQAGAAATLAGPAPNAALAATAPIIQGVPDLATAVSKAFLQHVSQNAQNSTLALKTAEMEKQKAAAAAQPVVAKPAPGSFAEKLGGAANGLMGALGDASHASDTKGGWLSGVANTLNARSKRLAENEKDKALLAKTQAETVAMHRNIYQQDAGIRQAAYKGNQDFENAYKENHDIENDIDHAELMKRAQADKDFATKYFVRATGENPVLDANGEPTKDKDGNPVTSPTYSIITRDTKNGEKDDKTVTPEMSADFKRYGVAAYPPNTKLTSNQFAASNGQLNLTRNAVNILNNSRDKELTDEQMKVLNPYLTDTSIQQAISHVPGSAYAGLLQYQQNADLHIQDLQAKAQVAAAKKDQAGLDNITTQIDDVTKEKQKVSAFTSQAVTEKQVEAYKKDSEEGIKWVDKILHDPTSLSGDKASGVIPQLQQALKTETDPGNKMKLTSAIDAAKLARDNYFEDMSRKATADQMAKQGDPVAAGRALADGKMTLADLRTRGTTADFLLKATDEATKLDKNYNPADEVNFEHIAKSPQGATFFGSARSLLSKGGTMDQLTEWGKKIPNNSLPTLNTAEDWVKLKEGKGPLAGYAALVLGVADDYGKVMGGGSASDNARDAALHLFAAAQTPEQRRDAINATLGAVGSQFDGRVGNNRFLAREYGDFVRSPLAPASENPVQQKISGTQPAATTAAPAAGTTAAAKPAQVHATDVQRPKDLPTATNTKEFKNAKTGQTQLMWADISGKPLRAVAPGELPKE